MSLTTVQIWVLLASGALGVGGLILSVREQVRICKKCKPKPAVMRNRRGAVQ